MGELLRTALPAQALEKIFSLDLIRRKWTEAVGSELARRSEPAAFEAGLLTVRVQEPAWGRVIVRLKSEVMDRLNRALGLPLVRRLRFVNDGVALTPPAAVPAAKSTVGEAEPPVSLLKAAASIPEPELRELVLRAGARYLALRGR